MARSPRRLACGLLLLLLLAPPVSVARGGNADRDDVVATTQRVAADSEVLIPATRGDLPIVLTSPHGGTLDVPGAPPRKDTGARTFVALRDTNTAELTERLADAIERELGKRPYVVIARFHRKYADANRPPTDAYDHAKGKLQYDAFHAAIRSAVNDVRARWGTGLLLDIHGQVAQPDAIYRGTRDGKTVTDLLGRAGAGRAALVGPDSVLGRLAASGYAVLPANAEPDAERASAIGHEERFNGGHIVFAYGSQNPDGIDAMQLEFGTELRRKARLDRTAADVAKAVASFAHTYMASATAPVAATRPAATTNAQTGR